MVTHVLAWHTTCVINGSNYSVAALGSVQGQADWGTSLMSLFVPWGLDMASPHWRRDLPAPLRPDNHFRTRGLALVVAALCSLLSPDNGFSLQKPPCGPHSPGSQALAILTETRL